MGDIKQLFIQKGDLYWADLTENKAESRQGGKRPFLITSNNMGNASSSTVQGVPLTTKRKTRLPVHVELGLECGLPTTSIALIEQEVTIPKSWLGDKIGHCTYEKMQKIEKALLIQKGIDEELIGLICAINNLDEYIEQDLYMPEIGSIKSARAIIMNKLKIYCDERRLNFFL